MSAELDVLVLVAGRLDAARIPYMLSGSTAMNVYAEPRMTRDIDIMVESVDWSYLERWAADLAVADLLAEVRP